jgi:hypothetical protein
VERSYAENDSSGRQPDIWLEKKNEVLILVESKLGASAGDLQLEEYAAYLAGRENDTPLRMLVFLTELPQGEFCPETLSIANEGSVAVVHTRWQSMVTSLEIDSDPLSEQFAEMLTEEKLVNPAPIVPHDWDVWAEGTMVALRLAAFQDEIRPRMEKLADGFKKTGPLSLSPKYLYRIYSYERFEVALGFNPAPRGGRP